MQRRFCQNDLVDSHATAQSRKRCFWNEHFLLKESQCFCLYCDLRCCNDYYMKKICSTRSFHLAQQFFSSSLYAKRCLSLTKLCFHFHDVHDKQQRESCDEILKNVFQCFRVTTGFYRIFARAISDNYERYALIENRLFGTHQERH